MHTVALGSLVIYWMLKHPAGVTSLTVIGYAAAVPQKDFMLCCRSWESAWSQRASVKHVRIDWHLKSGVFEGDFVLIVLHITNQAVLRRSLSSSVGLYSPIVQLLKAIDSYVKRWNSCIFHMASLVRARLHSFHCLLVSNGWLWKTRSLEFPTAAGG